MVFNWLGDLFSFIWKLIKKIFGFKTREIEFRVPSTIVGGFYWASGTHVIEPQEINATLLTHIYYAYLEVEEDGNLVLQNKAKVEKLKFPEKLRDLKKQRNPQLKLIFSIINKNANMGAVAASPEKRKTFALSTLAILKKYGYDGIDIDWEYPRAEDKENFVLLLKETSEILKPAGLILTACVRAIPIYDDSGYDVPEMAKYLDFFNLMTYDYYGGWSEHTGFNAPLYASSLDSTYEEKYLNVSASLTNWIEAGAPKEKICLGIPFYGRTFTLADENEHGLHRACLGSGTPAAIAYNQIIQKHQFWKRVWDDEQKAPYMYYKNEWIGYDDEESIREKVTFALEQNVAGVFVWQISGDDFSGKKGVKQFLLTNIYHQIILDENIKMIKEEDRIMEELEKKFKAEENEKNNSGLDSKGSSLVNLEELFPEEVGQIQFIQMIDDVE